MKADTFLPTKFLFVCMFKINTERWSVFKSGPGSFIQASTSLPKVVPFIPAIKGTIASISVFLSNGAFYTKICRKWRNRRLFHKPLKRGIKSLAWGGARPGVLMVRAENISGKASFSSDREGVTPVVGTILLIAITIALVAVVLAMVGGLGSRGTPLMARIRIVEAGQSGVILEHEGGDDLVAGETLVRVEVDGSVEEGRLSDMTNVGGTFAVGEQAKITGVSYTEDDTVKVTVIDQNSKTKVFEGSIIASVTFWSGWYDLSWNYRKKITIDYTKVGGDLNNFPLTISILDSDLASGAKPNGDDILFTKSNGTTKIPHEIEKYDNSTGELVAHAKIPNLSSTIDTEIYMYYGNPNASNQEDVAGVWDSNYQGVWHLSENYTPVLRVGVATQAAMDGGNGGWAVLYGSNPVTGDIDLAVDEDQIGDSERNHITEQVGYWAFEEATDIKDSSGAVKGEIGKKSNVGTSWVTVELNNSYSNPVVVTTYNLPSASDPPAITRVKEVYGENFKVKIQNPGDMSTPTSSDIYYVVVESGAHTLPGGVSLEAGSHSEPGLNHDSDWSSGEMTELSLTKSFSNPVVLGQVMSFNDSRWQAFWCSNGSQGGPPTSGNIYVGRHVAEDSDTSRSSETIGWIVVDASTGTTNGIDWKADLGADTVRGVSDSPPYSYSTGFGVDVDNIFKDSTSNNYDAGYRGSLITHANGKIGHAVSFGGSGDCLPVGGKKYTSSGEISELTVSAWVKSSSGSQQIISSFDRSEYWRLSLKDDTGTNNVAFDTTDSTGTIHDLSTSFDYADGSWHYICAWFKAGASPDKKIFVDGQPVSQASAYGGSGLGSGTDRYGFIGVGSEADGYDGSRGPELYMDGPIDEHRISNVARSAEWIATVYNNQSSPETFYSVGSEETPA